MPLLKQGRIVENRWVHLDDQAPVPSDGALIISLARWRADRESLLTARSAGKLTLGIILENNEAVDIIHSEHSYFDVIVLKLPKFSDGRAYSQARLLKDRLGYKGEVRAQGDVLRDQFRALHRCGFDAFELPDDLTGERAARDWQAALGEFRHAYQPATRGPEPIISQRHRRAAA